MNRDAIRTINKRLASMKSYISVICLQSLDAWMRRHSLTFFSSGSSGRDQHSDVGLIERYLLCYTCDLRDAWSVFWCRVFTSMACYEFPRYVLVPATVQPRKKSCGGWESNWEPDVTQFSRPKAACSFHNISVLKHNRNSKWSLYCDGLLEKIWGEAGRGRLQLGRVHDGKTEQLAGSQNEGGTN